MENYPKYFYGVIYKIINLVNNKCYIGYTTQEPEEYIQEHFKNANKNYEYENKYFYNAIRKYGEKNFKWRILGFCFSLEELKQAEKDAIWIYRSFGSDGENFDRIYGYNLTPGGEGTTGHIPSIKGKTFEEFYGEEKAIKMKKNLSKIFTGIKISKETKNKISKGNLDKKRTKEVKDKQSENTKGKKNGFYGKKHSKSTKIKCGDFNRGKSFKDIFGEEKAKEIGDKKRINAKNNPNYGMKGKKQSEEAKRKQSKSNKGRKYINKNSETKKVKQDEVKLYLKNGWKLGRK